MSAPASISGSCLLEPLGEADVVGVHPGDDLVRGGAQSGVEGRAEAEVLRHRDVLHRDRAGRDQLGDGVRQRVGHGTVLDDHHLRGRAGLLEDRGGPRLPQEAGVVAGPGADQQRERLSRCEPAAAGGRLGQHPAGVLEHLGVGARRGGQPGAQAAAQRLAQGRGVLGAAEGARPAAQGGRAVHGLLGGAEAARAGEHPELVADLVEEPLPRVGVGGAEDPGLVDDHAVGAVEAGAAADQPGGVLEVVVPEEVVGQRQAALADGLRVAHDRDEGRRAHRHRPHPLGRGVLGPGRTAACGGGCSSGGRGRRSTPPGWPAPSAGRSRCRRTRPRRGPARPPPRAWARCRRRAARPGRGGGSAPARCRPRNRPAPPVFCSRWTTSRPDSAARSSAVPSVEALSTTTITAGGWVWPRSAASDSASRSRRFQVTTTATTRAASARGPAGVRTVSDTSVTLREAYGGIGGGQQADERSSVSLAAYPWRSVPIEPPVVPRSAGVGARRTGSGLALGPSVVVPLPAPDWVPSDWRSTSSPRRGSSRCRGCRSRSSAARTRRCAPAGCGPSARAP